MRTAKPPGANRLPSFLFSIVLIVMALAFVAIGLALSAFSQQKDDIAIYLAIIAGIALALSVYILFQGRSRTAAAKIEAPKTMTTIECKKCGFKTVRPFQRGDWVAKELEKCEKCDDKSMITAIYKETKDKDKTYNI
jgi:ribosomal protein L37AE/L43A